MIAAIYARKSTEQSGVADEQKSVARQVEHARAYAAAKGWTVDNGCVFVDDGISGAEFAGRPGFVRLIAALKPRPPFEVLVMSEESRLGREAIETAYALKQLVAAGVRVFFYLEDRERTLDSPTDKIMLSLTAFADELERERARQRTYDAMIRKARAGHVTGGRVFGYENVRSDLGYVVRVVNDNEAEVIRRIFNMCAAGDGMKSIAIRLNDDRTPSPRARQGVPRGWAPSTVREVLYRDLYRGVVVWNRTRKRDAWGRKRPTSRPENEWIRTTSADLRIVTDEQWNAAHARLDATRQTYMRGTAGRLWGRPATGLTSKYLLTGLATCARCGGGVLVKSRAHGRKRAHRYACSSYHLKGTSVCSNSFEIPMGEAHALVLDAVEKDVLAPEVVETGISEALALVQATNARDLTPDIERELRAVEAELRRLTAALAAGGALTAIVDAIREREQRRSHLERQLAAARSVVAIDPARLKREMLARVDEWRELFGRQIQFSRQFLQKSLVERISCEPVYEDGQPMIEIRIRLSLGRLVKGLICPSGMASPTGFEPVFWP